jgi:hypothetical protein
VTPISHSDPPCVTCGHTRAEHAHGYGQCWPARRMVEIQPGPLQRVELGESCDCARYEPGAGT